MTAILLTTNLLVFAPRVSRRSMRLNTATRIQLAPDGLSHVLTRERFEPTQTSK